jgi:hypothetical protein
MWVCRCGALSLTRERVCRLQFLLVLARAVILGSKSSGSHDHILLSQTRDSPNLEGQVPVFIFSRNRMAGPRWKYSNPPPSGKFFQRRTFPFLWVPELSPASATATFDCLTHSGLLLLIISRHGPHRNHRSSVSV